MDKYKTILLILIVASIGLLGYKVNRLEKEVLGLAYLTITTNDSAKSFLADFSRATSAKDPQARAYLQKKAINNHFTREGVNYGPNTTKAN